VNNRNIDSATANSKKVQGNSSLHDFISLSEKNPYLLGADFTIHEN
jgi:hypothetical protein